MSNLVFRAAHSDPKICETVPEHPPHVKHTPPFSPTFPFQPSTTVPPPPLLTTCGACVDHRRRPSFCRYCIAHFSLEAQKIPLCRLQPAPPLDTGFSPWSCTRRNLELEPALAGLLDQRLQPTSTPSQKHAARSLAIAEPALPPQSAYNSTP